MISQDTTSIRARATSGGPRVTGSPRTTAANLRGEKPLDPNIVRSRKVLATLFGPIPERSFAIRFWDGTTDAPAPFEKTRFTLVLRHPGALRRMLLPPTERRLGEAYLNDDCDIEGDVEAATALAETIAERYRSPGTLARLTREVLRLPRRHRDKGRSRGFTPHGSPHSKGRDAAAIHFHYDVGNEFYALWLDRRMEYSCAFFRSDADSLDQAQEVKLDRICGSLRLAPRERFLDIGCGWGALVLHAATNYGVDATGITLSEEQARWARDRITAAGLESRCRIEVMDYRVVPGEAVYDKIASVGMVEHVGRAKLSEYYGDVARLLAPGGLFLNRGIVDARRPRLPGPLWHAVGRHVSFMQSHVFPDGELVPPSALIAPAEEVGLEIRELENLREQYMRTLRRWVQNLERNRARAVALVGESTYRVWRLYMAGSAHAFDTGRMGIVQALFGKPDQNGRLPLVK